MQVGIAFADKEYPARAAFGIVIKALDEFSDQSREAWRTATADSTDAMPLLEAAVQKYQVCVGLLHFRVSKPQPRHAHRTLPLMDLLKDLDSLRSQLSVPGFTMQRHGFLDPQSIPSSSIVSGSSLTCLG